MYKGNFSVLHILKYHGTLQEISDSAHDLLYESELLYQIDDR